MNDWIVLGVYPSVNNQEKVIARRGGQVVHIDRLPQGKAETLTQADFNRAWQSAVSK